MTDEEPVIESVDRAVVIARLNSGSDVIGVYVDKSTKTILKLEHPYFIRLVDGSLVMQPYCAFSPEQFFDIKKKDLQFVVTASEKLASRFISMIELNEYNQATQEDLDRFDAACSEVAKDRLVIPLTETYH